MYGAVPYLLDAFPELSRGEAAMILSEWMENYSPDDYKED
jgi:hypothetical protein